ncbi:hypothetical protein [Glycomyces sp. NRRL B-16210]|uniref:hypothetical protein n=1 Tax=Glycomyces sp. NRRL B-16210 TaxID=1463821 RepID=UPI0004BED476|nr:hypothetical protein [Glycomyces sp. NRRL B-16210]
MEVPPIHLIGEGRLAVPPAESDSRRYGTVILLDEHGNPVPLREFTAIGTAVLTATITEPVADERHHRPEPELLGIGVLFFERTRWNDRPALAAGVRPRDGRLSWWLEPRTLAGIQGVPLVLEAHESWPGCRCKPAKRKPRRRKRHGSNRKRGQTS